MFLTYLVPAWLLKSSSTYLCGHLKVLTSEIWPVFDWEINDRKCLLTIAFTSMLFHKHFGCFRHHWENLKTGRISACISEKCWLLPAFRNSTSQLCSQDLFQISAYVAIITQVPHVITSPEPYFRGLNHLPSPLTHLITTLAHFASSMLHELIKPFQSPENFMWASVEMDLKDNLCGSTLKSLKLDNFSHITICINNITIVK